MAERDVVVLSGRSVCSLLVTAKTDAGIAGQDGGLSVQVGDTSYWFFGDTVLSQGGLLPNSAAWTVDTNASDCIELVPKEDGGRASPLLPQEPGELTVWPTGIEQASPDELHFYFISIIAADAPAPDEFPWRVAGVGIGTIELPGLTAERLLAGSLIWQSDDPLPTHTFSDDKYIYTLHDSMRDHLVTDTIVSRVPKDRRSSPAAYEYWEPLSGEWVGGLWDEASGTWDPALKDITPILSQVGLHNGVEVAYNPFLDSWLGVYAANLLTSINVRAAQDPLGPWSDEQTVLIDCSFYHGETSALFPCYTAVQHETYSRDGGRTIYITYSISDDYQVYLHEIRLAASINEWIGAEGEAAYLPAAAEAPAASILAGLGFYASDIPVPGFDAIHQFRNAATGQNRYGSTPPAHGDYQDLGVAFYAPTDADAAAATNELYSPVFRWTLGGGERYSPMNLLDAGYEPHEVAFYSPCPGGDSEAEASCLGSIRADEDFDSDGDGCSDLQELGLDATAGGQRDPNNFWDFFDVPDAANVRDGNVSLSIDIFSILYKMGATDEGGTAAINRNTDPMSPPPVDLTAYHPAFDRSPGPPGAAPWSLGPPDGRIDFVELFAVVWQYGHTC